MSPHDDKLLLAAVAVALGETLTLVRRRGFHIDTRSLNGLPPLTAFQGGPEGDDGDDTVDLAAYGIDWDACDDSRLQRRPRRLSGSRLRRRVA
jgi:hypothetical protein